MSTKKGSVRYYAKVLGMKTGLVYKIMKEEGGKERLLEQSKTCLNYHESVSHIKSEPNYLIIDKNIPKQDLNAMYALLVHKNNDTLLRMSEYINWYSKLDSTQDKMVFNEKARVAIDFMRFYNAGLNKNV